jgi:hypothetical protein
MHDTIIVFEIGDIAEAEIAIVKRGLVDSFKGVLGSYFIVPMRTHAILALEWVEGIYKKIDFRQCYIYAPGICVLAVPGSY